MFNRITHILGLVVSLLTVQPALAQDYEDYEPQTSRTRVFSLFFDDSEFGYETTRDGDALRFVCDREAVRVTGNRVIADGDTIVDATGFTVGPGLLFTEITGLEVRVRGNRTVIDFYTRSPDDIRYGSRRRGNRIEPFGLSAVEEDRFVRGNVFSVTGDIEIYGEVNRNVVSLFGDIFVGPEAAVRGDVVSMEGRIELADEATVYGRIRSGTDSRLGRRHKYGRFRGRYAEIFDYDLFATEYNRVDGLSLGLKGKITDPERVLPSAWAGLGYAFETKRWRYRVGLEQPVYERYGLVIGGELFRELASEDDRLIRSDENTAFALLFRKDYRDYYEAEGARAYVRAQPVEDLTTEVGYRYEETNWYPAERDLWSLFGGDKFDYNFGSVPETMRQAGAREIDTTATASIYTKISFDNRDRSDPFYRSGLAAGIEMEWSHPDLESSFDNRRYRLTLVRHQSLNRRLMAIVRGVYGGSDGYLPMHRRYYLGGLGTLHGYDHKEYSGAFFWMINAEYRFAFPHSDLAASLFWDVGQVGADSDFEGAEVKHSLGVSFYLGSDVKIMLAKRLDRSNDDDPRLYARFTQQF